MQPRRSRQEVGEAVDNEDGGEALVGGASGEAACWAILDFLEWQRGEESVGERLGYRDWSEDGGEPTGKNEQREELDRAV